MEIFKNKGCKAIKKYATMYQLTCDKILNYISKSSAQADEL